MIASESVNSSISGAELTFPHIKKERSSVRTEIYIHTLFTALTITQVWKSE